MKLQIKVALLVVAVLLITGIISGSVMLYFQRRAGIDQFERTATALALVVQGSLEQSMMLGERKYIQDAVERMGEEEMVRNVVLVLPDGTIAASNRPSEIGQMTGIDAVIQSSQSGATYINTEESDGRSEFSVITPVFNQTECYACHSPDAAVLGVIKVGLDATPLDNQVRQQSLFFAIGGVSTIFIIGGGLVFALKKTVLNPLSGLTESTQQLSRGDYTVRAQYNQDDEIGMLSRTFNEMAESVEQHSRELEASRQELARWNIDLEDKVKRRTRELTALNTVITTISQSLDLSRILSDALNEILAVMETEAGMVHLLNETADRLNIMVYHGLSRAYVREVTSLKPGEYIVGQAAQSGESVVINTDNLSGPRGTPAGGKRGKFRAGISVPVSSKNRVLGVLSLVSRTSDRFDAEMVNLLTAMGDAIGIAVENAKATKSLGEVNRIREQLLEKLISAQEEERRRIARELHDDASQSLAALAINLENIAATLPARYKETRQKLDVLKERAIQTLGGIRNLALELRPSALDDLGLSMALDWYIKDYLAQRHLDASIEIIGPKTKLPSYTETMMFRIIQEALTNIVKHAEATRIRVQLEFSDSMVVVEVEDNGKGFDVGAVLSTEGLRQNLGIHGMAERAALLGGTFSIESKPGQGTYLRVEVPVKEGTTHE